MTLYKWSQTASSDANADSTIDLLDNQAPSTLKLAARAMMAAIAKFRDDLAGNIATSGTSTAYTLSSYQGITSLTNNFQVSFTPHTDCGAAPTLAVDSQTAKPLRPSHGVDFPAGMLKQGSIYTATYNTANSEWIVEGFFQPFASSTVMSFFQASAPSGWTQVVTYNDAILRVVNSTGGGAKTSGSGLSALTVSGTTGGHSLTQAELPNCNFTVTDPGHSHTLPLNSGGPFNSGGGVWTGGGTPYSTNSATTGITVASGGSGTAHTHSFTSGTVNVNYCDMILASKN